MRALILALALIPSFAFAEMAPRDGWSVTPTQKSYADLIEAVKEAAGANKLGVVTEAGPTEVAAGRGVEIPGNRVIGLFNNVYAVRILNLSTPAMIEAPIRMYVTENPDGTATLSYKTPTMVFAPYYEGTEPDLQTAAEELDTIFAVINANAVE